MKQRSRNLFRPDSDVPYKLSRSRMERFFKCPRCFYLDRRFGVDQVGMPAFRLNSATDTLLKKEFDQYRAKGIPHPLMTENGIDAIPFAHPDLDRWRTNFTGIQFHHEATNFILTGAIDDLWIDPNGSLLVVDYKSTSTSNPITLEGEYKQAYKRQMEFYQWLLRKNGFQVSDTSWFVYVNGLTDRPAFDARMDFDVDLIRYEGNDNWVQQTVLAARDCLVSDRIPNSNEACEWCQYRSLAQRYEIGPV